MLNALTKIASFARRRPFASALAAVVALFAWSKAGGPGAHWIAEPVDSVLRVLALAPDKPATPGRTGPPGAGGPPPVVTISRPLEREIVEWDDYTGRFDAVELVEIRARVAGYLDKVHFKDGQQVAKGELLFTIDPRPFERAVEQARAEVAAAQTKIDNSKLDVDRGEPLLARKILSQKTYDDRANVQREAEAARKVAEARQKTAELDLSFTKVTAPIGGRMSRTLVTAGNYVTAGAAATPTLLTTIVSQDPVYLYFDVSEANALKYKRLGLSGQSGGITSGGNASGAAGGKAGSGAAVEIALPDEKGFPHRGKVDFSDNRLDAATGTLRARAIVENAKGLFAVGQFARVRVAGSPPGKGLLLPDEAVGTDQINKFVLVVADDGTVQRRIVTLGTQVSGLRVVRSGLTPQDWVVVKGLQRARPGAKVDARKEELKLTDAAGVTPAPPATAR